MLDDNRRTLLHVSLIAGVGPGVIINKILKGLYALRFPDHLDSAPLDVIDVHDEIDVTDIYRFTVKDFIRHCGVTERIAQLLVDGLDDLSLRDKEIDLSERHQVRILTIFDKDYPDILKHIAIPPVVLYCQGSSLQGVAKRMALVGSRKADAYAQDIVNAFVPTLVAHDWEIVSGGAEGVDTMAHRATMRAGGRTVVVLGSGLLHVYPTSNIDFFKELAERGGTMLSPFPLNQRPDRTTFPARNRIIAGLSQGCVVVRAAERSGALITAQYALDQGRLIFAVPGSINDELSVGCHELIQQGAKLVQSPQDILEDFNEVVTQIQFTPAYKVQHEKQAVLTDAIGAGNEDIQEDLLLRHLSQGAVTIDELSDKTGWSLCELHDYLFMLQLKGHIQQDFTGKWLLNS